MGVELEWDRVREVKGDRKWRKAGREAASKWPPCQILLSYSKGKTSSYE